MRTLQQRFWSKVDKTDGCWLWTGTIAPNGYGHIGLKNLPQLAHRVSYELVKGPIPPGMVVMHSCDHPWCVNPAHLSVGTYADNTRDMIRKGRRRDNGLKKLSDQQALEAIKRCRLGETRAAVARSLGVSASTVENLVSGKKRKHLQVAS